MKNLFFSFLLGLYSLLPSAWAQPPEADALSPRQLALVPVAAFAAAGDLPALDTALHQALAAGMTLQDGKEVLVQVYAYAGFPRSLNALARFMQVVEVRQQQGYQDALGQEISAAIPTGAALYAQGTANQTQLVGQAVQGPLFEFAPLADEYLKTHLFGDIFSRDNLSWQDREIATLAMLAALTGVEPQLNAHLRIGMNTGLSLQQLHQIAETLATQVNQDSAQRLRTALSHMTSS